MDFESILSRIRGNVPPELYCFIEEHFKLLAEQEKKAQAALAENAAMRDRLEKNNECVALMERQLALLQKTLEIEEKYHET